MNILKTVKEGIKRVLKVNVREDTSDPEVDDRVAKSIKIGVRAALTIGAVWLFPEQSGAILEAIINFLGL